jgi:hypothetical protein
MVDVNCGKLDAVLRRQRADRVEQNHRIESARERDGELCSGTCTTGERCGDRRVDAAYLLGNLNWP